MDPPAYPGKKKWVVKEYNFNEIIDIRDSEGKIFVKFKISHPLLAMSNIFCHTYLDEKNKCNIINKITPELKDLPGYIMFKNESNRYQLDYSKDKILIGYWS